MSVVKTPNSPFPTDPKVVIDEWVAYTLEQYLKPGDPILKLGIDVVKSQLRERYKVIALHGDNKMRERLMSGVTTRRVSDLPAEAIERPDLPEVPRKVVKIAPEELLDRLKDDDLYK